MRIAVFGASGRTGRCVVEQAIGHGDEVVAAVRTPDAFDLTHERLRVVTADVRDLASVRLAVAGCDAVVSAIGAPLAKQVDLYSAGIGNIVQAMAEEGVSRLAVVSAIGTFARKDKNIAWAYRVLMMPRLAPIYDDFERMEQLIMASSAEWTIVRPPGLTDGPATGHYRVGLDGRALPKGNQVSRADVAALLLKSLTVDTYLRRVVSIAH